MNQKGKAEDIMEDMLELDKLISKDNKKARGYLYKIHKKTKDYFCR